MTLACNSHALSDNQREGYLKIRGQIESSVKGVIEIPDGFVLRFTYDSELFLLLTELIIFERLCCPFLNFFTEVGQTDVLSLRVTGVEGVKAFLKEEFSIITKLKSRYYDTEI